MRFKKNIGELLVVLAVLLAVYLPIFIGRYSPRLGLDLQGGINITLQAVGPADSSTMEKAAEIIRRRVNALGLTEPVVAAEGSNRVLVQVPGEKDIERVKQIVGTTAQLQFREVLQVIYPGDENYDATELTRVDPNDSQAYQDLKDQPIVLEKEGYNGQTVKVKMGETRLTGDVIKDAQAVQTAGAWEIDFVLTDEATPKFAELTRELQGKQLAIVLDYKLESFPNVKEPITQGRGQITGDFNKQSANDLALVLRLGALPVELRELTSEVVSATLGKESLNKGLIAGIVGLVLVLIYMFAIYRGLGSVALIQLALFGALVYGLVTLLGHFISWSLTLAGIAGIVVSIGISADSSVVYFERLKEEVRAGKTLKSSADRAFKPAFRTVIAADLTTFIAALILWIFAIGPVRGFAFTLGLSTILDVFINYFATHNLVVLASQLKFFNRPALVGVGAELKRGEA